MVSELLSEALSVDQVLGSPRKRKYFSEFLQEVGGGQTEAVLGLWEAIEDMRRVEQSLLHEVATL